MYFLTKCLFIILINVFCPPFSLSNFYRSDSYLYVICDVMNKSCCKKFSLHAFSHENYEYINLNSMLNLFYLIAVKRVCRLVRFTITLMIILCFFTLLVTFIY